MLSAITNEQLMSITIKAIYTKDLDPEIRDVLHLIAHKNGLMDEQGEKTAKYFSLMNDGYEKLIRELTGYQKKPAGLCACGCGRNPHGRSKYATAACRKKVSRSLKITDGAADQEAPVLSN